MSMVLRYVLLLALLAPSIPAQIEQIEHEGHTWLAERLSGRRAALGPNNCYFDGKGLRCTGKGPAVYPGKELNGGKSFAAIQGLRTGNHVSWFVWVARKGEVTLTWKGALTNDERARMRIEAERVDEGATRKVTEQSGKLGFATAGIYRIRAGAKGEEPIVFEGIVLDGEAIEGARILRTRWRPRAAHARFSASRLEGRVRVWIMEMDAAPGAVGFYSPMTTPFGYFGSSWTAEGRPKGMNFSLWSYGRGKKEPPIEKLSHLLAIGNPKARFGGFGHEGTGVKPRGWNPFEKWKGQRCVYAVRLEPGQPYDTYYSYYFDESLCEWRLFAAGRKAAKRRKRARAGKETSLFVGSFVEVPGPPARQRTGHIVRRMRYRGFVLNDERKCFALDRMSGEGKPGEICNRGRGTTKDHRFELWAGGMEQFGVNAPQVLSETVDPGTLPWMQKEALASLFTVPTTVDLLGLRRERKDLILHCRIQGLGKLLSARLYYGREDGLTFGDRWAAHLDLPQLQEGEQRIRVSLPKDASDRPIQARLLLTNQRGRFWSMQTMRSKQE